MKAQLKEKNSICYGKFWNRLLNFYIIKQACVSFTSSSTNLTQNLVHLKFLPNPIGDYWGHCWTEFHYLYGVFKDTSRLCVVLLN